MYSINGVALTNPTYRWKLRASSKILSDYSVRSVTQSVPGRNGVLTVPPQPTDAPPLFLVMQTTPANRERLVALMTQPGAVLAKISDPTRQVSIEFLSMGNDNFDAGETIIEITFAFRINDVFWRDVSVSTDTAAAISSASVVTTSMVGLSAPINDALIRVKGGTTGLKVQDSQGDFFQYLPALGATSYLIFDCSSGLAQIVTSNVWTGGTPTLVDLGPGPRFLQLSPVYGATFAAQLTVTTTARTGSPTIEVRAKRAFNG